MAAKKKRKKAPASKAKTKTTRGKKKTTTKGRSGAPTKASGPVARVWQLASSMPKAARKEVIDACVNAGVNIHTARTQYQRWTHRKK